jgi:hypothetical protein
MTRTPRKWPLLALALAAACGAPSTTSNRDGTGGTPGSGGVTASGGRPGSGGSEASGGSSGGATGGSTGAGGATATGGSPGTGGAMGGKGGSGGKPGTGGNPGTGGSPATGGSPGAGGQGTINDPPCSDVVDSVAPSIDPPGGLAANKVPMFVMLGYDDNAYADGINWTLDQLRGRKNADGTAALSTYFITGGFTTDFFNDAGGQTAAQVLASWKRIKAEGHEIGNHSWSHGEQLAGSDKAAWLAELNKANDLFVNMLGVEKCKLWGFRTPFLNFSQNTFEAVKASGLRYDTSIEFGYDWWQPAGSDKGWGPGTAESGRHYYWPFTTDKALPAGFASKGVTPTPGLWEFPVYTFNKITGETAATVTGLDFNLWTKCQSESTFNFTEVLKQSLDQRLAGNRSPFSVGLHSDIYSQFNQSANTTWTNYGYQARRKALADFIEYALSKPEVRLVTFRQLIAWMRKPTPL